MSRIGLTEFWDIARDAASIFSSERRIAVREKPNSCVFLSITTCKKRATTFQIRKDILVRFLLAYREAVKWMYSDPAALQRYAELADVSEGVARQLRDEFFRKLRKCVVEKADHEFGSDRGRRPRRMTPYLVRVSVEDLRLNQLRRS